jgi:preprotein translocase subunit Sec61beta
MKFLAKFQNVDPDNIVVAICIVIAVGVIAAAAFGYI